MERETHLKNPALRTSLAARLAQVWPHLIDPVVSAPVLLSAGWESDIYSMDYTARDHNGSEQTGSLVARLYFGRAAGEKAAREYAVLARLAETGYACPAPLWVEGPDSPWERTVLVMTKVPGEPMWPLMFRGEPAARQRAHAKFVELFVTLHSLDVYATELATAVGVAGGGNVTMENLLSAQFARIDTVMQTLPRVGFEDAFAWLAVQSQQVAPGKAALVHWDFHPANVLVGAQGSSEERGAPWPVHVIDWSGAGISDPRFDLAWTLAVVGSQEGWQAGERILRDYEAVAGEQRDMDFFLAFACARRLYVVAVALLHGAETLGLRPGAEVAIRDSQKALQSLYARWLAASSLKLAAVEQILA